MKLHILEHDFGHGVRNVGRMSVVLFLVQGATADGSSCLAVDQGMTATAQLCMEVMHCPGKNLLR
jgi:hypothetical protein